MIIFFDLYVNRQKFILFDRREQTRNTIWFLQISIFYPQLGLTIKHSPKILVNPKVWLGLFRKSCKENLERKIKKGRKLKDSKYEMTEQEQYKGTKRETDKCDKIGSAKVP